MENSTSSDKDNRLITWGMVQYFPPSKLRKNQIIAATKFTAEEVKKSFFLIYSLLMFKNKAIKKIILIEEAWSAISNAGMAEFLKYLYKTVRKFNGSVGIITQELEDIIGNPFVKNTILNNADIQILLDQTKYQTRFEDLAKLLGLPESETKKVMSINKVPLAGERSKDVYIRLGQVGKVYSVLVPPEEVAMYTTEAADSVMIDEIAEKSGDLEYGIIKYLDLKNANWLLKIEAQ